MDNIFNRMTAAILAGGMNTRFGGKDKAFALIEGVPMVERIVARLREVFGHILVITNFPERYSAFSSIETASDIVKNAGPLGGIHAAMKNAKTPFIFIVSCDMPHIDSGLIREQVALSGSMGEADALIPRINSNIEPLHGIYKTELAPGLESFLSSSDQYSIRSFLASRKVVYMDLPASDSVKKAFSNINSPSDLLF
jgi:molybdenum cofactor guanylyltransferase